MRTARGGPGRGESTRGGRHPALAGVRGGVAEVRARAGRPTRVWARCRVHEGAPVTVGRTAPARKSTRCYVLDTSVLLSDPWSMTRFDEHEVVLPLVVISELEGKRHHPELGWFARTALRMLDELRIEHGRLDAPVPIGSVGGTLHVELNHTDPEVLPAGFRTDSNDSRILACALNLKGDGLAVTLVTKDMPLRVKAGACGLDADEYRAQDVTPSGWTGMGDLDVEQEVIDTLYKEGSIEPA